MENLYKKKENLSLKNDFVSSNCYFCTELNAHNLIKLIIQFRDQKFKGVKADMFCTTNFNSQTCEKLFRIVRSMTTYSTIVNFSMKDLMCRIDRVKTINYITNYVKNTFRFPREEKKVNNYAIYNVPSQNELETFDIVSCVNMALNDAMIEARELGIELVGNDWMLIDASLGYFNDDINVIENEEDLEKNITNAIPNEILLEAEKDPTEISTENVALYNMSDDEDVENNIEFEEI